MITRAITFSAFAVALGASTCATTNEAGDAAAVVTCLPKGVYLAEAFNANWNEQQKVAYRASIDALRILNCQDPILLGYGIDDGGGEVAK